jgi:hypothetical protein
MKSVLAGLAILVIGDSHMAEPDYLIATLHDALLAQGAAIDSYGLCASVASDWLQPTTVSCGRTERHNGQETVIDRSEGASAYSIDTLIARHHPDLVVVELGDTMAGYGLPAFLKPGSISKCTH